MSKHKVILDPDTGTIIGTAIDFGEPSFRIKPAANAGDAAVAKAASALTPLEIETQSRVASDSMLAKEVAALTSGFVSLAAKFNISREVEVIITDPRVRDYELPGAHTVESAGYDLRAFPMWHNPETGVEEPVDSVLITAGEQVMVSTGLRVWIDKPGYGGFMFARSGSGSKGLVLGNGTGVIDSDYQGDLRMCLWNRSNKPIVVNAGDRVAQMVIMPVFTGYQMVVVDEFSNQTERGVNGFGSSGVK